MSYSQILVHVDETPAATLRARTAADLASRFKAHLTGVFLTSEYIRQYMAAESLSALPRDVVDEALSGQPTALDEAGEAARMAFEAAAGDAGVASDWLTLSGDYHAPIMAAARRADLTVMPRVAKACLSEHEISAAHLAMASGGPVLITPQDDYAPPVGRRVLVAWNGGREAGRALRDAWPILETAEEVHVLVVSPKGEGGPDGMLQRLLERHGVVANLIVDPSQDESAGDVLERQAAELGADMVVMGLYGRPRLQELILGGVSRQMTASLPVPILVSH